MAHRRSVSGGRRGRRRAAPVVGAIVWIVLVAAGLVLLRGAVPLLVAAWYLVLSAITFAVYASDKRAAVRGAWRTPESSLWLLGLVGGWPGGLLAQGVLRHKTRKASFLVVFWVTVVVNIVALVYLVPVIRDALGN